MKPVLTTCGCLLVATVLLLGLLCADAGESKRKKIVVYIPQKVKHIHHHHVKKVLVQPKTPYYEEVGEQYHRGDGPGSWEEEGSPGVQETTSEHGKDSPVSSDGWRAIPQPTTYHRSHQEPIEDNHQPEHPPPAPVNHQPGAHSRYSNEEYVEVPQHIRDWVQSGYEKYSSTYPGKYEDDINEDDDIRVQVVDVDDTSEPEKTAPIPAPITPQHTHTLRDQHKHRHENHPRKHFYQHAHSRVGYVRPGLFWRR